MTASQIKLDARTLLGFKIVAGGETAVPVHSPKIGGKGCPAIAADVSPAENGGASQSGGSAKSA